MINASTLAKGAAELRRGFDFVRRQFFTAVDKLPIQHNERAAIRAIITRPSEHRCLLMCDFEARQKSGEILLDALAAFYQANGDKHSHTYMGTLAWDLGVSPLARPRIALRALRQRTDKLMRRHNLHGVYFVELDIILRLPWEKGPRLHAHVHMWCWHPDRQLKVRRLAKTIMQTHDLPNDTGARSVVFTKSPLSAKGVVSLGAYLMKEPACVKQRRKKRISRGYRFTAEQAKYSPRMALRTIEILSQLSIYECVGGVGEGTQVSRLWKRRLFAWARDCEQQRLQAGRARGPVLTQRRARRIWRELRQQGFIKRHRVIIER